MDIAKAKVQVNVASCAGFLVVSLVVGDVLAMELPRYLGKMEDSSRRGPLAKSTWAPTKVRG